MAKLRVNLRLVAPKEMGLILGRDDQLRLVLPNVPDDTRMTPMQLFLGMLLLKAKDQQFVDQIVSEYRADEAEFLRQLRASKLN